MAGRWSSSGATEHYKDCHGQFNWLHPKALTRKDNFYQRKINEALEIQCYKTGLHEESGINRDTGNYVQTDSWWAFFYTQKKERPNERRWKSTWSNVRVDWLENSNSDETNQQITLF